MKNNLLLLLLFSIISLNACTSVTGEEKTQEVSSTTVVAASQSWDGTNLPNYPLGTPKVTLLKITIPPKTKLALHKHPIINVGYLTKGELTVVKEEDGNTLVLKEGDGIVELVNQYHYGVNNGEIPAEIIVFYAGDKDSKLVELE